MKSVYQYRLDVLSKHEGDFAKCYYNAITKHAGMSFSGLFLLISSALYFFTYEFKDKKNNNVNRNVDIM